MIKKIAQVINEANLLLKEDGPDIKAIAVDAVGHRVWSALTPEERKMVRDAVREPGTDIFMGKEVHEISSPEWLQPGVESEQIDNIIRQIAMRRGGKWVLQMITTLKKWPDGTDEGVILRENLKSIIRFLLRPHWSSGKAGVASDDETTDADEAWISQIDNESWFGIKNILFQILLPILKDTGYDITPEEDHPDISNSPWEWLRSPFMPWNFPY